LLAEGIDVGASGETNLFWGNLQVIDTCKKMKIVQPRKKKFVSLWLNNFKGT